jgi:tetratricopeptide (TPR) repeat protein
MVIRLHSGFAFVEERDLLHRSLLRLGLVGALALIQACAQTPAEQVPEPVAEKAAAKPPEITLNLPTEQAGCDCMQEAAPTDYTFLDKGYAALAASEYEEAVAYFQRYLRLEPSAEADWEAEVAITYVMTLPESPTFDVKEARKRFRDLNDSDWQSMQLHEQTLLLRHSLESFLLMSRRVRELREENEALRQDLEKREEAIKRLRELTLGQTGAAP